MAKTRCPARYKNLGLETFGEKKKVTEEILKQCCKNDEWLRQNLEEVRYLTPPAVRKRRRIAETIDEEKSWGCTGINGEKAIDNKIQFSNRTNYSFTIDLTTEEGLKKWYDDANSTTEAVEKTKNADGSKYTCITLPPTQTTPITKSFGTAEMYNGANSAWYVGFNKSRNFYLRPNWIKNWKGIDVTDPKKRIPAIARSQTFKVPTGYGGKLTQLDLGLEYNGTPTMSSSPLTVQIWNTYQGYVLKSTWDDKTHKAIPEFETISHFRSVMGREPRSTWKRYKKVKVYEKYTKGDKKGQKKKDSKGNYIWHYKYKGDKKGNYIRKKRLVAKPDSKNGKSITKPLAEVDYDTKGKTVKGGNNVTMTFKNPPKLEEGKSYAIVLMSPLNNWENCPRWKGWGRNCKKDKNGNGIFNDTDGSSDGAVYKGGDAFYSTDNGISWVRYGKSGFEEDIKVYKQGKYTPQDYRFKCRMQINDSRVNYPSDQRIMRLKPIYGNPIYKITVDPIGDRGSDITERNEGFFIDYEFSTDGDNWYALTAENSYSYNLSKPSKVVFIRAKMQTDNVGDANTDGESPYIEKLKVTLNMLLPTEMYARTQPYSPEKFGTILGASVWGRVFAPYTLDDETSIVDCSVDIIQTKENEETFKIVHLESIDDKFEEIGYVADWLEEKDSTDSRCSYLTEHPEILTELKENYNLYILPYELDEQMHNLSFAPSNNIEDLVVDPLDIFDEITEEEIEENGVLSFIPVEGSILKYPDNIGGIKFNDEVASPVISCQLEPEDGEGHGEVSVFGEWYDYTFNYKTNELIFKRDTLNRMADGSLTMRYNPVFIKDLHNNEIGIHYDEDGNRTDGLILDYFKEKIAVTNEIITSNKVKLRADALDPIRQVYLHSVNNDEPISLIEDSDYYYDTKTHEILFDADEMTPLLRKDDVLEIVYTPNLDDTAICIGYNATRKDTSKQCYIDDYYIEYKV